MLRQIIIFLSVISTIGVNLMASFSGINGVNTADISNKYDTLITPPGYVFAIWGVIYLGLIVYAFYQALPLNRGSQRLNSVFWPVVLSTVANIGWLFAWHYERLDLSMVLMLVLLVSLASVYFSLKVGMPGASSSRVLFVHVPFSIYLSWITIATIANFTILLSVGGWDKLGFSQLVWAIAMIVVAGLIGVTMLIKRHDFAFAAVTIWALIGIMNKNYGVEEIKAASIGMLVLLLISAAYTVYTTLVTEVGDRDKIT